MLPASVDVDQIKLTQPGTRKCLPRENQVLHLPPRELKLLLLILRRIKRLLLHASLLCNAPSLWVKICSNKRASLLIAGKQSGRTYSHSPLFVSPSTQHSILLSFFFSFLLIVIFKELGQKQVNNAYRCCERIRSPSAERSKFTVLRSLQSCF